jgi:hypothetical protein
MAKKKRSAALFEVMVKQEQRRLPKRPGVFHTIYLWFKNRPRQTAMEGVVVRAEAQAASDAAASEAVAAPAVYDITTPIAEPVPVREEYAPPRRERPITDNREPGVTVRRERGALALRMSYGTAMITTFTLATVVVVAFLIGRKWSNRPQTVLATTTTDKIRQQPPRPNLTNVNRPARPTVVDNNAEQIEGSGTGGTTGAAGGGVAPARSRERTVGLNYVMVQAYLEEKHALQAATLLQQNGIECTVERGVPGFLKYSVVGMIGFSRISSNTQLEAYMSKIRSIGDLYSRNRSSFIYSFKPQPFKWNGTRNP